MARREHLSPLELQQQLDAERRGAPFVAFRDGEGRRRILALATDRAELTIGRAPTCDIWLEWDAEVSGLHATLERLGSHWVVADEGLSRNGTWVNGDRLGGRRRLRDGDRLRCGQTAIAFSDPVPAAASTAVGATTQAPPRLSEAQRRVLLALCRPLVTADEPFALPATNQEIAAELFLSVEAVKTHLRAMFEKFEIRDLPQNRKRLRLAELAIERGAIAAIDLVTRRSDG
jgi:pSer/pThr/pTyr-binding forkhead associated (FHA) protein